MSVCFVCLEKTKWKVCFTCSAVAHPSCWNEYTKKYDNCSVCRSKNIIRKPKTRAKKPKTYSNDLIIKFKDMCRTRESVISRLKNNIREVYNVDDKDTKLKYVIEIMHILIVVKDYNDSRNILLNTKFKHTLMDWFSRNDIEWSEANEYKQIIFH